MLIPYSDENPTSRFAFVTLFLILANTAVFLYQIFGQAGFNEITNQFAMIPVEIMTGKNLPDSNQVSPYMTVLSFMFLHGGITHLLFNMLFLWIFGNNIEDRMTPGRFLIFYLITGIISGLAFALLAPQSKTPLIGASGAVSGILGAYLFMYPFTRINALLFIFRVRLPALIFIVFWFVTQILGFLDTKSSDNTAWVSHIAGFIAGIILFKFFTVKRKVKGSILS